MSFYFKRYRNYVAVEIICYICICMMLYEVLITGYPPWGFRISGGLEFGQPTFISRLTPGGKAHQSNVQLGDILLAVNGRRIHDLRERKVMKLIKSNNDHLHLTLERNLDHKETTTTGNRNMTSETAEVSYSSAPPESTFSEHMESSVHCEMISTVREPPTPKARKWKNVGKNLSESSSHPNYVSEMNISQMSHKEFDVDEVDDISTCSQRTSEYEKTEVNFKPQVHWLHGKLRLMRPKSNDNNWMQEGVKSAILSHSGRSIELEGGEVTLRHSQYNTPARLYSDDQMLNVIVEQATSGRRCDPNILCKVPIEVNRRSSVYKLVHNISAGKMSPLQSPSINLLEKLHQYQEKKSTTKHVVHKS